MEPQDPLIRYDRFMTMPHQIIADQFAQSMDTVFQSCPLKAGRLAKWYAKDGKRPCMRPRSMHDQTIFEATLNDIRRYQIRLPLRDDPLDLMDSLDSDEVLGE